MSTDNDSTTTWITNEIPDDTDLHAAMGLVAIHHSQLDYMLRYVLKTLSGRTVTQTFLHTAGWYTGRLREHVSEVAARKLDDEPLKRLEALLDQCKDGPIAIGMEAYQPVTQYAGGGGTVTQT